MLPVLVAAICAIAIGVRTANRARAVDTQLTPDNPLQKTAVLGTRERTVAVMPFESISPDPADAYLARGHALDDSDLSVSHQWTHPS